MNARPPGRPRILSRERIVAAARRIADDEGLDALTVRRVAQLLGTGQASLYRHIRDRDELLRLLAEDVAVRLPAAGDRPDPRERVVGQWLDAYDYLSRHRWAARIIAEGEYVAHGASAFADSAFDALGALAGAAPGAPATGPDLPRAYRVLWHLLLGHVLNVHPVGHTHAAVHGEDAGRGTGTGARADVGAHPDADAGGATGGDAGAHGANAARDAGTHGAHATRDDFAWALPRVLDGMFRTP
ncbi:TetR family transcriptional regulator [Streptomyces sp. SID8381]|uniref:TetR/AcrR family transcriptional regulator n=1 Tax=unclassified Streptomyces TaxID=2593676 RepID=UPI00036231C6|nr:TetR/AcrR family transcriptional regulator [Streptomyces sp. Amel2xE9]MYX27664.1 TetR family transcriptional regulator [Streptomyces sp. SID8381]